MGFRDLKNFNIALLSKQFWCLYHDPTSLLHRVYKAKFFPQGTILDASSHRRGSYAWQSIITARDSIIKGACWRVGDGAQINIPDTRWLPEPHHRKILSPIPNSFRKSKVSDLILPLTHRWNTDLIDCLFLPYDAIAIKSIPLSDRHPSDKLIWPGEKLGRYTVRSEYHFLMEEKQAQLPSMSTESPLQHVWKEIWSLNVPKKIQQFMWRATKDSLPTKCNLAKKKILPDPTCELCKKSHKDIMHALWSCPLIQNAWSPEPWLNPVKTSKFRDFADLLVKIFSEGDKHQNAKFGVICRALWNRRNKVRLNKPADPVDHINAFA